MDQYEDVLAGGPGSMPPRRQRPSRSSRNPRRYGSVFGPRMGLPEDGLPEDPIEAES